MASKQRRSAGLLYHKTGAHLWNAPNSLLGLLGGLGGRAEWRPGDGIWEIHGGWLLRLLRRRVGAMTLGDVVLYQTDALRPAWRDHEMVHVRQARRWGPFFLPAYLLESLWQWLHRRDPYHDNRFERDAYAKSPRKDFL